MTPPENKGGSPDEAGGRPEPKSKAGICEYCEFPQEMTLRPMVMHGVRYWACESCRRVCDVLSEES